MIPYLPPPVLRVGGLEVPAFDLLAAAAVLAGHGLAVRRAVRLGFDRRVALRAVTWTVAAGVVGSHLAAVALYDPGRLAREPLALLEIWGAMSSAGGVLGGVAGALWALRREGRGRRLAFLDAVAFAFPFAWALGRLGCALAHDHLGVASASPLAVAFPGGGRLDLGLLELLWTLAMAALWLALARRRLPAGALSALWLLLYCPVRLGLDALRTDDHRVLLGLTFGQLASAGGLVAGAWLARVAWRAPGPAGTRPAPG